MTSYEVLYLLLGFLSGVILCGGLGLTLLLAQVKKQSSIETDTP